MNIFGKIKNVFTTKKKVETKIHKNLSNLIIDRVNCLLLNKESTPSNLKRGEWETILESIRFSFQEKESLVSLRSIGKRKIRQRKIENGFINFQKHYKEL